MKRAFLIIVSCLLAAGQLYAQQRDMIRVSVGPGFLEQPRGLDVEVSGIFPLSSRFATVIGVNSYHFHHLFPMDYGDKEVLDDLKFLRVGVCFYPLMSERHHLSFGLSLGLASGHNMQRKVLYYDSGPYYVYDYDVNEIASVMASRRIYDGSDRTTTVPIATITIDYVYFLTDHLGLGVSTQTVGAYFLCGSLTWRF
ncbi:MAG: hypothetical protein IJV01_03290 [Bacteroidales bacterium]|nr:hypothetical protein [Bacteroidales bacterium]